MDRRTFLALGATGAAATVVGLGAANALAAPRTVTPAADLVWAANFTNAENSDDAGFGNVQVQYGDGDIQNNGPAMPVVDHPKLGKTLKIATEENQERWEAEPGAANDCGEGDEYYFRFDFVLDSQFPVDQDNPFCIINQVHHGGDGGSPPIEFDVRSGKLAVRGASDAYDEELSDIQVDTKYKVVYRVKFSSDSDSSLLEVWLNEKKVLSDFHPPCATMIDGNSYWKGASMYLHAAISPVTVYQNAHRVGTTYDAVNA